VSAPAPLALNIKQTASRSRSCPSRGGEEASQEEEELERVMMRTAAWKVNSSHPLKNLKRTMLPLSRFVIYVVLESLWSNPSYGTGNDSAHEEEKPQLDLKDKESQ